MNAITQAIVNHSKLEVTMIKITEATLDTFLMAIESKVTGTGPIGSTISPMTVDLVGPGGKFGTLDLPVIKTSSSGAEVIIPPQNTEITDMAAFKAFVTALLRDDSLLLQLKNGKGTVKAMMSSAEINYNKDCPLKGMNGPKSAIVKTEALGDGRFKNTMKIINPSPVEIDLGTVKQELRNQDGSIVAKQQGKLYLLRGETTFETEGKIEGKAAGEDVLLVATGVEENNWNNETITAFETSISLPQEFLQMAW